MNFYKFYEKPEELNFFNKKEERMPEYFYNKLDKNDKEKLKTKEKYIKNHPYFAMQYALNYIKGPWPEGEDAIAKSGDDALWYTTAVLHDRFKKGEKALFADEFYKSAYIDYLKTIGIEL